MGFPKREILFNLNPQFSLAHGCGSASTRIYGARLGQRARRTVIVRLRALSLSRLVFPGICPPSLCAPVRNAG